jgi:hypothetical protein
MWSNAQGRSGSRRFRSIPGSIKRLVRADGQPDPRTCPSCKQSMFLTDEAPVTITPCLVWWRREWACATCDRLEAERIIQTWPEEW